MIPAVSVYLTSAESKIGDLFLVLLAAGVFLCLVLRTCCLYRIVPIILCSWILGVFKAKGNVLLRHCIKIALWISCNLTTKLTQLAVHYELPQKATRKQL